MKRTGKFGKSNPNYKTGNRIEGNHPCPCCSKPMWREKRRSNIICRNCYDRNRKDNAVGHKVTYKKYYEKNKEKIIKKQLEYYHKNKEDISNIRKLFRKNNPELVKERNKKQRKDPKYLEWRNKYERSPRYRDIKNRYINKRLKEDKTFAIQLRLRRLVHKAIKMHLNGENRKPSKKYGIDYQAIIDHLKPFPKDLSRYEIDHVKPLCLFKFVKDNGEPNLKQIQEAFSPQNHQWLTITENRKKSGKY